MPPAFRTLISPRELVDLLPTAAGQAPAVVVDCRSRLGEPDWGQARYNEARIPGAFFASLEEHLSAPAERALGRHPLPPTERLCEYLGRIGISPRTQVIAYDQREGCYAARLWFLLRYLGHEAVAVLDGGWEAWERSGLQVETGKPKAGSIGSRQGAPASPSLSTSVPYPGRPRPELLATVDEVLRVPRLVDSRDPRRFRGELEPVDPVAGHIPGARNRFYQSNLQAEPGGGFRSAGELRSELAPLFDGVAPSDVVFYCGSGVTACQNLLAASHAGFEGARLYPGSWSQWCSDPSRPVARGDRAPGG